MQCTVSGTHECRHQPREDDKRLEMEVQHVHGVCQGSRHEVPARRSTGQIQCTVSGTHKMNTEWGGGGEEMGNEGAARVCCPPCKKRHGNIWKTVHV